MEAMRPQGSPGSFCPCASIWAPSAAGQQPAPRTAGTSFCASQWCATERKVQAVPAHREATWSPCEQVVLQGNDTSS